MKNHSKHLYMFICIALNIFSVNCFSQSNVASNSNLQNLIILQEEFNGNQYSKIGSTWKYFVPGSSESFDVITQRFAIKYLVSATESQKIALEQANNLTRKKN